MKGTPRWTRSWVHVHSGLMRGELAMSECSLELFCQDWTEPLYLTTIFPTTPLFFFSPFSIPSCLVVDVQLLNTGTSSMCLLKSATILLVIGKGNSTNKCITRLSLTPQLRASSLLLFTFCLSSHYFFGSSSFSPTYLYDHFLPSIPLQSVQCAKSGPLMSQTVFFVNFETLFPWMSAKAQVVMF